MPAFFVSVHCLTPGEVLPLRLQFPHQGRHTRGQQVQNHLPPKVTRCLKSSSKARNTSTTIT